MNSGWNNVCVRLTASRGHKRETKLGRRRLLSLSISTLKPKSNKSPSGQIGIPLLSHHFVCSVLLFFSEAIKVLHQNNFVLPSFQAWFPNHLFKWSAIVSDVIGLKYLLHFDLTHRLFRPCEPEVTSNKKKTVFFPSLRWLGSGWLRRVTTKTLNKVIWAINVFIYLNFYLTFFFFF